MRAVNDDYAARGIGFRVLLVSSVFVLVTALFGAAASPLSGGYGLQAMRERAEQCGGSVTVESEPGEGTTVVGGITKWVLGWERNGWMTSAKQPVKNVDLWKRLDAALGEHDVRWRWVKGHAGHELNERVESLLGPFDGWFICGPGPMMDAAEASLLDAGVPASRILIERFTAGKPSAAVAAQMHELQDKARGVEMWVTLDGRKRKVAFDADAGNILDSARASGLPAPYACKAGVCATCRHGSSPRPSERSSFTAWRTTSSLSA